MKVETKCGELSPWHDISSMLNRMKHLQIEVGSRVHHGDVTFESDMAGHVVIRIPGRTKREKSPTK